MPEGSAAALAWPLSPSQTTAAAALLKLRSRPRCTHTLCTQYYQDALHSVQARALQRLHRPIRTPTANEAQDEGQKRTSPSRGDEPRPTRASCSIVRCSLAVGDVANCRGDDERRAGTALSWTIGSVGERDRCRVAAPDVKFARVN